MESVTTRMKNWNMTYKCGVSQQFVRLILEYIFIFIFYFFIFIYLYITIIFLCYRYKDFQIQGKSALNYYMAYHSYSCYPCYLSILRKTIRKEERMNVCNSTKSAFIVLLHLLLFVTENQKQSTDDKRGM